jgi:UDP-N-acetylmuramyl pentapeptide synthase
MKLHRLLAGAEVAGVTGPTDVEIQSVVYDSRKVTTGAIFFALRGEKL